jgi:hypothetical protein
MKIVKVGAEPTPVRSTAVAPVKKGGRKPAGKSMRTYPRGVLKGGKTMKNVPRFEGVRDPSRSPPVRKSTLKILTDKGEEKRRKKIRKTVRELPDQKVRTMLRAAGLPVSDKTPAHIAKEILEGGMEAGMIVSK